MARVAWSPDALADLDTICRHIASDSPTASRAFARRVRTAVARLADFPASGRVVPEAGSEALRELIVAPYRVIYTYSPSLVEIATIIHGARPLVRFDGEAGDME